MIYRQFIYYLSKVKRQPAFMRGDFPPGAWACGNRHGKFRMERCGQKEEQDNVKGTLG